MAQLELQDIERRLDAVREVVQDASRFNDDFEPKRVREELLRAERMLGDLVGDISAEQFEEQDQEELRVNYDVGTGTWELDPAVSLPSAVKKRAAKRGKNKRR